LLYIAGKELQIASETPEFLLYLIAILQEQRVDIFIRVAAACLFKNFIIQNWNFVSYFHKIFAYRLIFDFFRTKNQEILFQMKSKKLLKTKLLIL
jgi:hypothetical protein